MRLCGRKNTNKTGWDRISQPRNTNPITDFKDRPLKQNLAKRFKNDASEKEILLHAECGLLKYKQDNYKIAGRQNMNIMEGFKKVKFHDMTA